ncbi:MAG: hypothetical protein ACMUEM_02630 [Flavobacteriales bacterium AspAUS03]
MKRLRLGFFSPFWGLLTEVGILTNLIIPIVFFIGLYIFFERIFIIRTSSRINLHFTNHITDMVYGGKFEAILEYYQNNPIPKNR